MSDSCLLQSNVGTPTIATISNNSNLYFNSNLSLLESTPLVVECATPTSPIALSSTSSSNESCEIEKLFSLRTKYHDHPLIGFLNINSLRNKIIDLRVIVERCLPDILVIGETKLGSDFRTENFLINEYQVPMRRDRNEFGGGLLQYVRKGVLCNRISALETSNLELLCSEMTVNKRKWIIYSIYRPPDSSNIDSFFRDLTTSLNIAFDKYDNVILMGDINIDTLNKQDSTYNKFLSFCDIFGLANLVTDHTCFTKNSSSSIDVILTNRPRCF